MMRTLRKALAEAFAESGQRASRATVPTLPERFEAVDSGKLLRNRDSLPFQDGLCTRLISSPSNPLAIIDVGARSRK